MWNSRFGRHCFALLTVSVYLTFSASAQRNEQLWFEFQLDYPFGGKYLFESTLAYQKLLVKENGWSSIGFSPTFEYTMFTRLDLTAEIPLGHTNQSDSLSTFEASPLVGGRFHITQNRRVNIRFMLRYQSRNLYTIESEEWENKNRMRVRGEAWICINGPNLFTDKLWYAFLDFEEFFVIDAQVSERFANLRRTRVGVGYRLDYKHRFEATFTAQASRDEIEEQFNGIDNVIQLRYKLFLNPSGISK